MLSRILGIDAEGDARGRVARRRKKVEEKQGKEDEEEARLRAQTERKQRTADAAQVSNCGLGRVWLA